MHAVGHVCDDNCLKRELPKYFDKNGEVITEAEYGRLMTDRSYRVVGSEAIPMMGLAVTTLWQGVDAMLGMGDCVKPLVSVVTLDGRRTYAYWSNSTEAFEGHENIVSPFRERARIAISESIPSSLLDGIL